MFFFNQTVEKTFCDQQHEPVGEFVYTEARFHRAQWKELGGNSWMGGGVIGEEAWSCVRMRVEKRIDSWPGGLCEKWKITLLHKQSNRLN